MEQGYLYIERSPSHPGLLRLLARTSSLPPTAAGSDADPATVYVARFNDIEAARLHAFSALRRRLLDVDSGLFRVDVAEAIAVVESIALAHRRLFLDPALDDGTRRRIADRTATRRRRKALADRFWQVVGWVSVGWLFLVGLLTL